MREAVTSIDINVAEFARILRIGLGRAIRILREEPSPAYRDAILHACLHNTAYDPQVEGSRAEYVLDVIGLTGEEAWYRDKILEALRALPPDLDDWDTEHLLNLAGQLAGRGDIGARQALYDRFLASTAVGNDSGATQIVEADGLQGFVFVADRLVALAEDESDDEEPDANDLWKEEYLLQLVEERLGKEEAATGLARVAAENPRVAEFVAAIRAYQAESAARREARPQQDIDYLELRRLMHDPDTKLGRWGISYQAEDGQWESVRLSGWGIRAADEDIAEAAADLLEEEDRDRLLAYLRIFDKRPFPLPLDRLISLATGTDDEIASAAIYALTNISAPKVRELALELLSRDHPAGGRCGTALGLLTKNYQQGDRDIIERLLQSETDVDGFHWLAMRAMDVFKANSTSDARDSLLLIYERGPCSNCREWCVELLRSLDLMPEWMIEECLYDSNPEIREQARQWQ